MKLSHAYQKINIIEDKAFKEKRNLNNKEINDIYNLIKEINTLESLYPMEKIRFEIELPDILNNATLFKHNYDIKFGMPILFSSGNNDNFYKLNNKSFKNLYLQVLKYYNYKNYSAISIHLKFSVLYMYNYLYNIENMENLYKEMLKDYINTGRKITNLSWNRAEEIKNEIKYILNDFGKNTAINFIDIIAGSIRMDMMLEGVLEGTYYKWDEEQQELSVEIPRYDTNMIMPVVIADYYDCAYKADYELKFPKDVIISAPTGLNSFLQSINDLIENDYINGKQDIIYWYGLHLAEVVNGHHHAALAYMLNKKNIHANQIINIKDNFNDFTINNNILYYKNKEYTKIPDPRFAIIFNLEKEKYNITH